MWPKKPVKLTSVTLPLKINLILESTNKQWMSIKNQSQFQNSSATKLIQQSRDLAFVYKYCTATSEFDFNSRTQINSQLRSKLLSLLDFFYLFAFYTALWEVRFKEHSFSTYWSSFLLWVLLSSVAKYSFTSLFMDLPSTLCLICW